MVSWEEKYKSGSRPFWLREEGSGGKPAAVNVDEGKNAASSNQRLSPTDNRKWNKFLE